jgi:hypothetical protein
MPKGFLNTLIKQGSTKQISQNYCHSVNILSHFDICPKHSFGENAPQTLKLTSVFKHRIKGTAYCRK